MPAFWAWGFARDPRVARRKPASADSTQALPHVLPYS